MSTWYKEGVMGQLSPEANEGRRKIAKLYNQKGQELHITSLREGTHSAGSKHWQGDAWDQRFGKVTKKECKAVLGDDFDVVDESNHRHIEYDPKI